MKGHQLLIPNKDKSSDGPTKIDYGIDTRAIETAFNNLPEQSSGAGYASLTGPGETTTPGRLIQEGDLDVIANGGLGIQLQITGATDGLVVTSDAGVNITDDSGPGITIQENGLNGIAINDTGGGGIIINLAGPGSNLVVVGMPTADPGISGALWNNGGVVNVSP